MKRTAYAAFRVSICTSPFSGGAALKERTSMGQTETQMPQPMQELFEVSSVSCLMAKLMTSMYRELPQS